MRQLTSLLHALFQTSLDYRWILPVVLRAVGIINKVDIISHSKKAAHPPAGFSNSKVRVLGPAGSLRRETGRAENLGRYPPRGVLGAGESFQGIILAPRPFRSQKDVARAENERSESDLRGNRKADRRPRGPRGASGHGALRWLRQERGRRGPPQAPEVRRLRSRPILQPRLPARGLAGAQGRLPCRAERRARNAAALKIENRDLV